MPINQSTATPLPGENLTPAEMQRVMDVARELGRDTDAARRMLGQDAVRQRVRARLLRYAEVSGERITESDIDGAIEHYVHSLLTFREPPWSWEKLIAYGWVFRYRGLAALSFAVVLIGAVWALFWSAFAPLNQQAVAQRAMARQHAAAEEWLRQIKVAAATDDQILGRANALHSQVLAADPQRTEIAAQAVQELEELHRQLWQAFEVRMIGHADAVSLFHREFRDDQSQQYRSAGFYAVVQAIDLQGNLVPQWIENVETGARELVDRWAERIPEEVYQRLADDKRADGVLHETAFARKERGRLAWELLLPDSSGKPIERTVQLTHWD